MKKEESNNMLQMVEHLGFICQKLNLYHTKYNEFVHEINDYIEHTNRYKQNLMTLFIHETAGRSLSSGLSDIQIYLSKAIDSLEDSKNELNAVYKKLKGFEKTIDRLVGIRETIETCNESIERIKSKKAHPDGQA